MPEPRPDDVPDELLDLYGRNYVGNRTEQAERKALAAVLAVHERQVRERAERAERDRDKALDQITDERRGRLAAEAAVRRARQVLAGMHDGVLVRRLLAALTIDQPKETP